MKNATQNKRKISSIPVLLIILFVSIFTLGLTLAWYKMSITTNDSTVTMGNLDLEISDDVGNKDTASKLLETDLLVVPNELITLNDLNIKVTANMKTAVRLKIAYETNTLELQLGGTLTNWTFLEGYYYYTPASGETYLGYLAPNGTTGYNTIEATNIKARIPNTLTQADAGKTATFYIEVQVIQAGWATGDGVDTSENVPVGNTAIQAATAAAALLAWGDDSGEGTYLATPYTIISDAPNMNSTELQTAMNNAPEDVVYIPEETNLTDVTINAEKSVIKYEIDETVMGGKNQVNLASNVNLANTSYATITGIEQVGTSVSTLALTSYIFESGVEYLQGFAGNTDIVSIVIPPTVKIIDRLCFSRCTELVELSFADNSVCTSVGDYAFEYCTKLKTVSFGVANNCTLGMSIFSGCTAIETVIMPWNVSTLEGCMFSGCTKLSTITFPTNTILSTISESAFYQCESLSSFNIPMTVTTIGNMAFGACGFTSIDIPANVETLGDSAFSNCEALTSVLFLGSSKLTTISRAAFDECTALESITIPNSVKYIGSYAFRNTRFNSVGDVNIPTSLEYLGYKAFPNSCCKQDTKTSGFHAFYYLQSGNYVYITDIAYSPDSLYNQNWIDQLAKFQTDGKTVKVLAEELFNNCTKITSISIPESVTVIPKKLFSKCILLETVNIPNGVTTIGEKAFYGCRMLTSIVFPSTVTKLENALFVEDGYLVSVNIYMDMNKTTYDSITKLSNWNIKMEYGSSFSPVYVRDSENAYALYSSL